MKQPDMKKVAEAVAALEAKQRSRIPDHRNYPVKPTLIAQDAAIRKPLRAHGNPCCGFNCSHFLNRD